MEQIDTSTFSRLQRSPNTMLEDAWSRSSESDFEAYMNEISDDLRSPLSKNYNSLRQTLKHRTIDPWGPS